MNYVCLDSLGNISEIITLTNCNLILSSPKSTLTFNMSHISEFEAASRIDLDRATPVPHKVIYF